MVNATLDEESHGHDDEKGIADWSSKRFEHIINLREEVLDYARRIWADFIFVWINLTILLTKYSFIIYLFIHSFFRC